jgi:MFS family permease
MSRPLGKNFARLFSADLVSQLGDSLNFMARAWLALSISQSSTLLSLVFIAASLPEALLALSAGSLADRYVAQRRNIVVFAYAVRAPVSFALGLLALQQHISVAGLLTCTALLAVGRGISTPATKALLPQLVEREDLERAIGRFGAIYRGTQALGPALGGVVVALIGIPAMFFLDALSYVAGALISARVRVQAAALPVERRDIAGVMVYIRGNRTIRLLLIFLALLTLVTMPTYIAYAVLVKQVLQRGAVVLGMLLTSFAIGYAIGALVLLERLAHISLRTRAIVAGVLTGACLMASGYARNPILTGILVCGAGIGYATVTVTMEAWLQLIIGEAVRARVHAVLISAITLSSPLAYLGTGLAVNAFSAPAVIATLGGAYAVIAAAMLILPQPSAEVARTPIALEPSSPTLPTAPIAPIAPITEERS